MATGLGTRLLSGAVGAAALTTVHQLAQQVRRDAPRMDLVGMEVLARTIASAGGRVPRADRLFRITLAGDLISNGLYYSAVPAPSSAQAWRRATGLGLLAGAGALLLPRYVAAGDPPHSDSVANNVMTVAWYLAGALAAAACAELLRRRE
jgi:hypothetical protein